MRFFSEKVDDLVIDQTTGGLFDGPAIAWLSADTYVVTWEHSPTDSGTHDIYARVFNVDGIPQTDAFVVNPAGTHGGNANIVATPDGGFVISWWGPNPDPDVNDGSHVWARGFAPLTYQPLEAYDDPIGQQLDAAGGFGYGDLAVAGNGDILATWTEQIRVEGENISDLHIEVFGVHLDASGAPAGAPFMITPGEPAGGTRVDSWAMATAGLPGGGFAVLYQSDENFHDNTFDINSYLKVLGGSAVQLTFNATDVAYAGNGAVVVVGNNQWHGTNNDQIIAQLFSLDGEVLSQPTVINTNPAWEVPPTVAGFESTDAGFIVTWVDYNDDVRFEALHLDFTPVQVPADPSLPPDYGTVGPDSYYFSGLPGVSVGPDGSFAIAWSGGTDDDHIVADVYMPFVLRYQTQIFGTEGDDLLIGDDRDDDIRGFAGNDVLRPDRGDDSVDGGSGYDRVSYFQTDVVLGGINVSLRFQEKEQDLGWAGNDILAGIESLSGTPFADRLEGDDANNWLWGSTATYSGGLSETNNDTLIGNLGDDILMVGLGNHVVFGGGGTDTLIFNELGNEPSGVTFSLATGSKQATGAGSWTVSDVENVSGSAHDDQLTGSGGSNLIAGDAGNDRLIGQGGNDLLYGDAYLSVSSAGSLTVNPLTAAGDDILIGGTGEDQLFGGDGVDTASYAGDEGAVFVNLTLGRGYGNASFGDTYDSIENVTGTDYNDFLIGDPGVNRLDGGAGNDTIIGAVGPDELIGGSGLDWASYEDNSGTVFVNLTLQQGFNNAAHGDTYAGIENVIGGLMDDFFIGDEAANRLNGAMGADTLLGAGGADVFMFTYAPGATSTWGHANADLILDFTSGADTIELAASAFPGLAAGTLPASAFVLGTAAADGSDRIIYDQATGNLFFDADGNGSGAAVLFATLGETSHPLIAASDFAVV